MEKTLGQIAFEAQRKWLRDKFPQLINPNFEKVEWEHLPALSREQYEYGANAVAEKLCSLLDIEYDMLNL